MSTEELPRKKTPKWVWFVGGGCALVVVVGLVAVVFTLRFVKRANDPELQWPKVAELLPFDERPDGWSVTGLPSPGSDGEIYLLRPPGTNDQITLSRYPSDDAEKFRAVHFGDMELEANAPVVGPVGRFDPVKAKLVVQGREVDVVRYYTTPDLPEKPDGLLGAIQSAAATSNIVVDVSSASASGAAGELVVLEIRRQGKREPIPDQDVIDLLAPFRIGAAPSEPK
ncbi:MAG: hypothetical protein L6Q99_09005 [Planctomycetes bacterium]|nr:hypothetical protein [Planctomycetota bacterium]